MIIASLLITYLVATTTTSGLAILHRNKRDTDIEQFISFVNEDGQTCAKESVRVTDNEARFDVTGKMAYVFDYEQELLIFKELYESDSPCHVTKFKSKIVPPPDVIKESLLESKKFEIPSIRHTERLQRSWNQNSPSLLPLSQELCENSKMIVMEKKHRRRISRVYKPRRRPKLRPKRSASWGEVVVIYIIVILSF